MRKARTLWDEQMSEAVRHLDKAAQLVWAYPEIRQSIWNAQEKVELLLIGDDEDALFSYDPPELRAGVEA